MDVKDIILEPLITEKSLASQAKGIYIFLVNPRANKYQIAQAIESVFGVRPIRVRVLNLKGKKKNLWRQRKTIRRSGVKKAMIQLKQGDKIKLIEGLSSSKNEKK